MIHKNRANRRYIKNKKIQKREKLLKELGTRGGTLFEKHIDKINKSSGYMSKHGNYTHYGNKSHYGPKTNSKDYGPAKRWSHKDKQQIESMNDKIKDFNNPSDVYLDSLPLCDKCYYQEQLNIEGHITSICHHKASMEGNEVIRNYYFCEEITECEYFAETSHICKRCSIKDGKINCYKSCPKLMS